MKLFNHDGSYLELNIKNYEFPDLGSSEYEEFDANWLDIAIKAKSGEYDWEAVCPCLLTWEVRNLLGLLRACAEDNGYDRLYFESPELYFATASREDGKCMVTCGLWLDMHPFSCEDNVDPYFMDFIMEREDLAEEVNKFALELAKFPRRDQ